MEARDVIKILNLKPLPLEGGYYSETYRSLEGSAIYYLLTPDTFSAIHRLPKDEIYHFYLGDPVEQLQLYPDGSGKTFTIGQDLKNGMTPQLLVPKGFWQGSRLTAGGNFALMGTTMGNAYETADYEGGKRKELITAYPDFEKLIISLTK